MTWSGLSVHAGGEHTVTLTLSIADALKKKVTSITNDGVRATSAQGPFTTGSPVVTTLAPPFAMSVAPAAITDGGKAGTSVSYHVGVTNLGFTTDTLQPRFDGRHVRGQLLRLDVHDARDRDTSGARRSDGGCVRQGRGAASSERR